MNFQIQVSGLLRFCVTKWKMEENGRRTQCSAGERSERMPPRVLHPPPPSAPIYVDARPQQRRALLVKNSLKGTQSAMFPFQHLPCTSKPKPQGSTLTTVKAPSLGHTPIPVIHKHCPPRAQSPLRLMYRISGKT